MAIIIIMAQHNKTLTLHIGSFNDHACLHILPKVFSFVERTMNVDISVAPTMATRRFVEIKIKYQLHIVNLHNKIKISQKTVGRIVIKMYFNFIYFDFLSHKPKVIWHSLIHKSCLVCGSTICILPYSVASLRHD